MAGKHALLSPSGGDRWMLCPGSTALSLGLPDKGSAYADEGTAAHFLASECLDDGCDTSAFENDTIIVKPEGADWYFAGEEIPEGASLFEVNEEMIENIQQYLDHIRGMVAPEGTLLVEQKLSISHLTGEDDATGTSDAIILNPGELIISDLKYGMGHRVQAEGNRQLRIYALGAHEELSMVYDYDTVRLVIIQPRIGHVSEFVYTVEELLTFADEVKRAAYHAMQVVNFEDKGAIRHHLVAGEDQCQWCRATAICPKLDETVAEVTGLDFEDLSTPLETDYLPIDLSTKLAAVGLIEIWCKAIRGKVESDLLSGIPVPGYKVVQGKKGNRKWCSPESVAELLSTIRMKKEILYESKLVSPTTATKLAKDGVIGAAHWKKLEALITQSEGKPSVAPESDKRPALDMAPKATDFDAVPDYGDLV